MRAQSGFIVAHDAHEDALAPRFAKRIGGMSREAWAITLGRGAGLYVVRSDTARGIDGEER